MDPIGFDAPHLLKLRPEAQPYKEVGVSTKLSLELGLIEPVRTTMNECLKPISGITNCRIDVKYYHDA